VELLQEAADRVVIGLSHAQALDAERAARLRSSTCRRSSTPVSPTSSSTRCSPSFDRFERGTSGQGSGLGLAIAKAYANAHGGDLLYTPNDGGACFELILPRG